MNKLTPVVISGLALVLAACSSSGDNSAPNTESGSSAAVTISIDASDYNTPAYFDFETGSVVSSTDDWDIAFKRTDISVNDGKQTAIADKQVDYYAADGVTAIAANFANSSNTQELPSLYNAVSILDSWITSDVKAAIDSSWYSYNSSTHQLSASGQYFILKSAEGDSYAKMTISDITSYVATVDLYVQGSSDTSFSATADSFTFDLTETGETCYDFDAASTVDCATSSTWDLHVSIASRSYKLFTNGGDSGTGDAAVYKLAESETESDYSHGDYNSTDFSGVYPASWSSDKKGSAFAEHSWYAYDPIAAGDHKLWTNYRVYVVDTDVADTTNDPVKMQILSYYNNATAASAHYTIRYMSLSDDGQ
jgi:hypothetical protein